MTEPDAVLLIGALAIGAMLLVIDSAIQNASIARLKRTLTALEQRISALEELERYD